MNLTRRQKICLSISAAALAIASALVIPGTSAEVSTPHGDVRVALEKQRRSLMDAIARRDAAGVAQLFRPDAKLMISGFDAIVGRDALQQAWQFALGSSAVTRLEMTPDDIEDFGGEDVAVETGTLLSFGKDAMAPERGNYVLVWKRGDDGAWKIFCDIASPRSAAAPVADRVGFPRDYVTKLAMVAQPTFSAKTGFVQTTYANAIAASALAANQTPYPYGSIFAVEFASPRRDENGQPLLDADGHAQRGDIARIDVMRREPGFGEAYGKNRAGEWEFVSYRPDGSFSTPPARTACCAECHLNHAGVANDFVFPLKQSERPRITGN